MRLLAASLVVLTAAATVAPDAHAQAGGHAGHGAEPAAAAPRHPRPAGWSVRYDRADAADSTLSFRDMPPGWHITAGPSGILYDASRAATGDFALTSEMFLFPVQRAEGYGVFVGGRDLAGAGQQYTYFLLRKDGQFTIKRRDGAEASTLVPWTAHPAVAVQERPNGSLKQTLGVVAVGDSVRFTVDGTQVAVLPRAAVRPDGIVGLRVNHATDLHVTSLDVRGR